MAAPDLARELRLEAPLVIDDPATPLPLPHADGTVDALVVAGPLQRAEDPTAWAAELRRVVRPDGAVLALAPDAGRRVWDDPELRRPFTAKSLRLLFADHGFAIVASGRRDGDLWVHDRREDASAEAQDAGGYFDWHKEPGYFRDVTRHFAPTDRVLDVGCGTAWLGDRFSDYVGIDSSEDAIRAARARGRDARVHRVDEPLPFDDASFDGVVAKDLLEHVADPAAVVAEIARVLRPGGRAFASSPDAQRWVWDDYTHVRPFTLTGYRRLFTDAGLVLDRSGYESVMPGIGIVSGISPRRRRPPVLNALARLPIVRRNVWVLARRP